MASVYGSVNVCYSEELFVIMFFLEVLFSINLIHLHFSKQLKKSLS